MPRSEVCGKAGDCVIFTETCSHGTLPWRGKHQRRALLYKFSPGTSSFGAVRIRQLTPIVIFPRTTVLLYYCTTVLLANYCTLLDRPLVWTLLWPVILTVCVYLRYLSMSMCMYVTGTARCGVSRMDPDHETRAGGGDASSVRGGGEEPAAEAIATEPTAVPQCIKTTRLYNTMFATI